MSTRKQNTRHGFSLTEVVIAIGLLAIGMLFIAGSFPVSIHLTTVATERTIAATVADEAFAKIKLYGIPVALIDTNQTPLSWIYPDYEYAYPSTPTADPYSKKFWWSAVAKRVPGSLNDIQVTVFVSRKAGVNNAYYKRDPNAPAILDPSFPRPVAVFVEVATNGTQLDELVINDVGMSNFINDGYTIVDDKNGNIYRVLERYAASPSVIRLDKNWQGTPSWVWAVPPPVKGGRYPCIGVYQKTLRF